MGGRYNESIHPQSNAGYAAELRLTLATDESDIMQSSLR